MGDKGRRKSAAELRVLDHLRKMCSKLPEVTETVDGHGHATFRVGKKVLAVLGDSDGAPSLGLKTDLSTQAELVKREDFFQTPYVGQHGWVSTNGSEKDIDWRVVQLVLTSTYRRVAPKRLSAQLSKD
jgi:predicted DNA-binding protein (MmcQ/YjbR family)